MPGIRKGDQNTFKATVFIASGILNSMNDKVNEKAVRIQSVFYFCTVLVLYLIISGHRKTLKALSRLSIKTKSQTNLVIPEN